MISIGIEKAHRRRMSAIAPMLPGLLAAMLLGGCSALPNSGPTADQIYDAAQSPGNFPGFRIVPISDQTIASLAGAGTAALTLPGAPEAAERIGPGDVLQITIFEIGSPLFSAPVSTATQGQSVSTVSAPPSATGESLPPVSVSAKGTITLPYIGQIEASGYTPEEMAAAIQSKLRGKSQDAQVVVTIRDNVSNIVMVMGDIRRPGRIPLTLAHEHLLDIIAEAGGTDHAPQDVLVRVTRGHQTADVSLSDLMVGSPANIAMAPADRIEMIYKPRTFSVFGATGRVSEIPFATPDLTLATALARAGGPSDQQADPSAVFIFRYETVRQGGLDTQTPVAYELDMLNPASYFLSQRFRMQSGDVIYVANAKANLPTKMVQILNLFFQPVYTARVLSQ